MSATLITAFQNKKKCLKIPGKYPILFSFSLLNIAIPQFLSVCPYHSVMSLHFFPVPFVANEMGAQSDPLQGVQNFQFFFVMSPVLP